MEVLFYLKYQTKWGQSISVVGSDKLLGDWNIEKAFKLVPTSDGHWEGTVQLTDSNLTFQYVLNEEGSCQVEFGTPRQVALPQNLYVSLKIVSFWRDNHHDSNSLYLGAFQETIFMRVSQGPIINYAKGPSQVQFELRAVRSAASIGYGIIGSVPELGNWQEGLFVPLTETSFPIWSQVIAFQTTPQKVSYKYVLYELTSMKVVAWESGENRELSVRQTPNVLEVIGDEYFRYPSGNWKGAGVAIPVFSLRTSSSAGVGEFKDIKLLIDWAVKTKMKVLQLLPVNDTIATQTWKDSYPYAAISVYALHPIYLNMEAVGSLSNIELSQEIALRAAQLNTLPELDYEEVLKLKFQYLRAKYNEVKSTFRASKSFKSFLKSNKHWLVNYAIFSTLRDHYNTADFIKWGRYARYDDSLVTEFGKSNSVFADSVGLYYFIQYHLDKQLKEVTQYGRTNGVLLKGDIPIGIYRDSVDAWLFPDLFNMSTQAGAPPDDFAALGQNWGFPTYHWERMSRDGFSWWKDRLVKMSEYFDITRIDHILGFFRIWEIPWKYVDGLMGHFSPSLPLTSLELKNWGINFDDDRFCKPYIRTHMIHEMFGSRASHVFEYYLTEYASGCYAFKEEFDSQRKIAEKFQKDNKLLEDPNDRIGLQEQLNRLHTEVIFLPSNSSSDAYDLRIAFHNTYSYKELEGQEKIILDRLHNDYFYHRHNDQWGQSAMLKLPTIKKATDMLICGEDLGMVPTCVPGVMATLNLLSLSIQRMPSDDREFWHPADTSYLSVTTTGSHDMSTLREWWQENTSRSQRFFNSILGLPGTSPFFCESWVV